MIEARERECNTRAKAVIGIIKEITDLGKELERDHAKAKTTRDAFTSTKDKVRRLTTNILME